MQNEEIIEDEKFVPPLDGEAAFDEIRGKAALKRGLFPDRFLRRAGCMGRRCGGCVP